MTTRGILVLAAILVAVMGTGIWGARALKKSPVAAREAGHQHNHGKSQDASSHQDAHEHSGHDEHGEEDEEEDAHVVHLSETQRRQLGIVVAVAQAGILETHLTLPGTIGFNTERLVHIVPRIPGVVREARKGLGDNVRAGDVLAVIDSRELADAKALYLAAGERVALAESTFTREKNLWEKKISAEQDYLAAKQALTEARIELQSAKHKLQALGLSEASLKQLGARPGESLTRYEIVSPLSGTVIEKHITAGELIKDDTEVFVVADLNTVWVTLQVPPTALSTVQKGQRVVISAGPSMPEAEGKIRYVAPVLLEETRTAVTRVELQNTDGRWRPGLFVTATIAAGESQASVLIPKSALQTIEGKPSVFVETEAGFSPRPVKLGPSNDTHVEITEGLQSGERYAATETFILKAEFAKGEAAHAH